MDLKTISTGGPGREAVPATNGIAGCLEALTQIAGVLEELSIALEKSGAQAGAELEGRVRKALALNVKQGREAFALAELNDACVAALELDGGLPVSPAAIRKTLPKLMNELFGSRLSCSIRRDRKYARGFRGIEPR
jgi:hypothetical protein